MTFVCHETLRISNSSEVEFSRARCQPTFFWNRVMLSSSTANVQVARPMMDGSRSIASAPRNTTPRKMSTKQVAGMAPDHFLSILSHFPPLNFVALILNRIPYCCIVFYVQKGMQQAFIPYIFVVLETILVPQKTWSFLANFQHCKISKNLPF